MRHVNQFISVATKAAICNTAGVIENYLKLGWYLFPIRERSKVPLTATGFKDASNDPAQIEEWQYCHVHPNWGLVPGMSGLVVVDFDVHKGGTRQSLEAEIGPLPETVEVRTGSGGSRLIYAANGADIKSRLGFRKGIDVLARTGYTVLPPSIHPNGSAYEWVRSPFEAAPTPLPENLLRRLTELPERTRKTQEVFGEIPELAITAGDGRWGYFQRFAGILRSLGWGSVAIREALMSFYENQCETDPELPRKIRDLAEWVASKPATNTLQPVDSDVMIEIYGTKRSIKRSQLTNAISKGAKLCEK